MSDPLYLGGAGEGCLAKTRRSVRLSPNLDWRIAVANVRRMRDLPWPSGIIFVGATVGTPLPFVAPSLWSTLPSDRDPLRNIPRELTLPA